MKKLTYIDLFAGAGGLSEGFLRSGFTPVAHIEMDKNACHTIRTRIAYHYLKRRRKLNIYNEYLLGKLTREDLCSFIPEAELNAVINAKIGSKSISDIFTRIDSILGKQKIDVIIGGPPCQAYSRVGRSRDPNGMKGDARNYLFKFYAQFLKRYRPKYFVFENVTGLLTAHNYFEQMNKLFQSEKIGYQVSFEKLNAADYGVLQSRERVIIIGRRGKSKFKFPIPKKLKNKWSVKSSLLIDLPVVKPGGGKPVMSYSNQITSYLKRFGIRNGIDFVTQHISRPHNARDLKIYKRAIRKWLSEKKRLQYTELPSELRTHKNQKSFLDRFKVVNPFGVSHTVVAHIAKDGHHYIYPDLKQVRSISVREAARIQSFPDDYFFEGGRTSAFNQIGNAVPPLMALALGRKLAKIFK